MVEFKVVELRAFKLFGGQVMVVEMMVVVLTLVSCVFIISATQVKQKKRNSLLFEFSKNSYYLKFSRAAISIVHFFLIPLNFWEVPSSFRNSENYSFVQFFLIPLNFWEVPSSFRNSEIYSRIRKLLFS